MELPPTWQPVELQCNACGKKWNVWQPLGVPVATWIAHVRSHHCPNCGAGIRNAVIIMQPPDEPEP